MLIKILVLVLADFKKENFNKLYYLQGLRKVDSKFECVKPSSASRNLAQLLSLAAQAYGFTNSNQSAANLRFEKSSMRLKGYLLRITNQILARVPCRILKA